MRNKCKNCSYHRIIEGSTRKKEVACEKQGGKIVQAKGICEDYQREYPGWVETDGTLFRKSFGSDGEIKMHVLYTVEGTNYICKEYVTFKKHEAIKIGIPIGYRSIPYITPGEIGTHHKILYNPKRPGDSHIKGNDGVIW